MNPLPKTNKAWMKEIALAYLDAKEAIPFGELTMGRAIKEDELFTMAPCVAYKFRNLNVDEDKDEEVTEGVLSSYIATTSKGEGGVFLENSSILSFAFCYLVAHAMLDLIEEEDLSEIMDYLVEHQKELDQLL